MSTSGLRVQVSHPHPQMHHAYESLSSGGRNGVEFGTKLEQRAQPGPMAASTQG